MRLSKKLIQLGKHKRPTIYNPKDGIPLQLYDDTFYVQLAGVVNTPEPTQQEMSPIPFITSVESGVSYDKNGDMNAITTIYTDYSDPDKTIFSSVPSWKPTTEYLRVETDTKTLNSSGMETHNVEKFNGDADVYIRTKNINGTSREKHFTITTTGLPTPYHDKLNVDLTGDYYPKNPPRNEMAPVPYVTSVESGMAYDKNGDISAATKVYTDYSDADKATLSAQGTFKPTEYLRAVQGETEITSQGNDVHDFDGLYGDFDLYIRTMNLNGSSTEHHLEIEPDVLPNPYHDKWHVQLNGSYRESYSYS